MGGGAGLLHRGRSQGLSLTPRGPGGFGGRPGCFFSFPLVSGFWEGGGVSGEGSGGSRCAQGVSLTLCLVLEASLGSRSTGGFHFWGGGKKMGGSEEGAPWGPPLASEHSRGPTLTSVSSRGLGVFLATLVFWGGHRVGASGGDTGVGDTPG